jgi:hypothetical protein
MKLFSHAYSFGLEVVSAESDASDVTGDDLHGAVLSRLASLDGGGVVAACDGGSPFDSFEVESAGEEAEHPPILAGQVNGAIVAGSALVRAGDAADDSDAERRSRERVAALCCRMLRDAGYAVSVFSPEELEGADSGLIGDLMVERGWDAIADLSEPRKAG